MKPKYNLLASASTVEGIIQMINGFWPSSGYSVDHETLAITNPIRVPEGYRVVLVRGRYRFECIQA